MLKTKACALSIALSFGYSIQSAAETTFTEIAPAVGITYERVPSQVFHDAVVPFRIASLSQPVPPIPPTLLGLPIEPHGLPGVAIFDYDDDGDLDILVTNGPGAPNHLYQNQLMQSGQAQYIEVAEAAGIEMTDMDANGVCYGDIDNDDDSDVLLLGRHEGNRLLINGGDGSFSEGSAPGGADNSAHASCSMGDINGDGLLDVVVANGVMDDGFVAIFFEPFDANFHNQLYLNNGDNTFQDVSDRIEAMQHIPTGKATITWATTILDIDEDGDQDIVLADDSGAIPVTKIDPVNGVDRSFVHIMVNDGTGHFTPMAIFERPESPGSWMGLGFGDIDHDGLMDIFGSNFGDYGLTVIGLPYSLGDQASRPLLQRADGSFSDPDLGGEASVFGWGNAVFDIDNDADSDVLYHGGLAMQFFSISDNSGAVLFNDGQGNLIPSLSALGERHAKRNVHGVAIGDLDRDGFVDVASVSSYNTEPFIPLIPAPVSYGSVFDSVSGAAPRFAPSMADPNLLQWIGLHELPGTLSIERNNGESGFNSITVTAQGSIGITSNGRSPRDGTGAVFTFTPEGMNSAKMAITAGSSHTSAHAQEAYFGMADTHSGVLEVLWPGGVRNRLYDVVAGETVLFPEIPCSINMQASRGRYTACVNRALRDLRRAGVIDNVIANRFRASAIRAYLEHN